MGGPARPFPEGPVAPALEITDLRGRLPTRTGARPYYPRAYARDPWAPTAAEIAASLNEIVGVTIHHTAGSTWATPEAIAAYQTGPSAHEQFPAIAYTLLMTGDGAVHLCHDLWLRTWQSGAVVDGIARNRSHVGICFTGRDGPTMDQVLGLGRAIAWCEQELGRRLEVEGHGDQYPTECPGKSWPDWLPELDAALEIYRT